MWSYVWPILVVIAANTVYNISAKSTPQNVHPFATMTITYITAAVISVILYYITSDNKNYITEMKHINWTSVTLGIAIVALEFGYIQVYRAGWNVSVGSLVANIGLAVVLVFVGVLLYKEVIQVNQIIGIILCVVGIVFLSK